MNLPKSGNHKIDGYFPEPPQDEKPFNLKKSMATHWKGFGKKIVKIKKEE
jgi:hypothetical protein